MARGGQDVIGFTRIFVLFCTLVLVPALFLSGFGVIAILNERQAERQRRADEANALVRQAVGAFGELLEGTDRAALEAVEAPDPARAMASLAAAGRPIGAWIVLERDGAVVGGTPRFTDDEALLAHLARIAVRAEPARPAHAAVDEGGFSGVVSMQRSVFGRAVVYDIDDKRLDEALRARFPGDLSARVRAADGGAEPVQNAVERLLEIVNTRAAESARDDGAAPTDEPDELAYSQLAPPFDRFTIFVETRAPGSQITMIAYIVLLVVFLATLITGVVITARLIWQETRLSRLKTDFVSHMSHELRTPLTSIRMFIDTLKLNRADSAEERQECLDLLAKETERLSEMIERVLGYARLKAGRRLFSPVEVPVSELIDEAIAAFRAHTLAAENLVLTTEVGPDLPPIHADRDALVEALLNLVSNAWKYTGPHKEITVFARAGRRGRVLIGVRDNGPGLPKTEHKRVFERFYQARSLLSSKQSGSGLGLAITRAIVEGNGGKIHVESEPGRGATFLLELRTPKGAAGEGRVTRPGHGASARQPQSPSAQITGGAE
jgi:two-component system, OmpR family, phosphate regulon sensor histidine kinase PhoR